MPRAYAIYDVFTSTALAGNPLAVVFDGENLSDEAMQKIAAEFNLSETVFVRPAENPSHTASLRIFTPGREIPFAGHPTVGTAIALAERRNDGGSVDLDLMSVLEEKIGPVRCVTRLDNREASFSEFDLPRLSSRLAADIDREAVATTLNIKAPEIGFENHQISVWNAGNPFVMIPVRDLSVAARLQCNGGLWEKLAPFSEGQLASAFVYCRGGVDHEASFHARMFAPQVGISEDPATGSAVAAFSGVVHHFDELLDGHHPMQIEQGIEMGRPSKIHLHLEVDNGEIVHGRIGGHAVKVAEGVLIVPDGI